MSQRMRKKFRTEKKERVKEEQAVKAIQDKSALSIDLLPFTAQDTLRAKLVNFDEPVQESQKDTKKRIMSSSIFGSSSSQSLGLAAKIRNQERLKKDPFARPALSQAILGQSETMSPLVEKVHHKDPQEKDPIGLVQGYASSDDDAS